MVTASIIVSVAIVALCIILGYTAAVPALALIAVIGTALLAVNVSNRQMTRNLQKATEKSQKATEELSIRIDRNAGAIEELKRSSIETDLVLHTIDNRARKINPTITDIAGSVGRMAPIVREIRSASNKQDQSAAPTVITPPANVTTKRIPAAKNFTFAEAEAANASPSFPDIHVAVIADEFTAQAFAYEWDTTSPTPDSWRQDFEQRKPDFLFVESAWEANNKSWLYHFVGPTAPRPAVIEITTYCRENGIPTVFWNKEDPPHFEDFLRTASLFDYVYTTDGNLIESYRVRLGHDRVAVLPFAAQPKMHNPARIGRVPRDRNVVFGGMYFHHKYPERREQLSILLPAATRLGLDIYSRQAGGDPNYQFPAPYSANVRGSLPYRQMLTAYHAYKVVLNVNSVVDSPTMCARRIFEATAAGAAVVTTNTPAIEEFFPGGLLTTVSDEEDAFDKMRSLTRSDEYRDRLVHRAQRQVWETATYRHRAEQIAADLGLHTNRPPQASTVVIASNRPEHIDIAFSNVARQNIANKQLVFLSHGFEIPRHLQAKLSDEHELDDVTFLHADSSESLGSNLNRLFEAADGDTVFRMDDDDYYGPNYARDLQHALNFSGSQVVGKAESYIYFEDSNSTVLTYIGHSHRHTDFIRGATFCGPRDTFSQFKFPDARNGEDSSFLSQVKQAGGTIYSSDRFNFLVRRRSAKKTHTWSVSDAKLFSSGEMRFVGDDPSQVDV